MKKLITILILLIVGTAVLGYLYFSKLHRTKTGIDRALSVSTLNAAAVIEFSAEDKFFDLMREQELLNKLIGLENSDKLELIKNRLLSNTTAKSILNGNRIFLSFVNDDKTPQILISTQLQDNQEANALVAELQNTGILKPEQNHLYNFLTNDSSTYFAGLKEDVFFVSTSKSVILERLNLTNNNNDAFKDYIEQRQNISKQKLMRIYVNYAEVDEYVSNLIAGRLDGELAFLNKNDAFAEFSYNFSKDKLQLFGTTQPGKRSDYFHLFKHLNGVTFNINGILPSNTSSYKFFGIDQIEKFQANLAMLFKAQNIAQVQENVRKIISSKYNLDLSKIVNEQFNKEIITFQLTTGERLAALAFKNGDRLNQVMSEIGDYSDGEIGIFKDDQVLYALFGDAFKRFNRPHFTIKNNYLIVAPNASTVRDYINSYNAGKLLINDVGYAKFRNEFPGEANLIFYFDLNSSKTIARNNLKNKYYRNYVATDGWGNFAHFAYQMSGDNGKFNTNIVMDKVLPKSEQSLEIDIEKILEEIEL